MCQNSGTSGAGAAITSTHLSFTLTTRSCLDMSARARRWFSTSAILLALLLSAAHSEKVFAQGSASVSGQVTDQTGAVIAGADVDVTEVDTGISQSTKTSPEGIYSFVGLKPGRYAMTVHKESFESVAINGLILNV